MGFIPVKDDCRPQRLRPLGEKKVSSVWMGAEKGDNGNCKICNRRNQHELNWDVFGRKLRRRNFDGARESLERRAAQSARERVPIGITRGALEDLCHHERIDRSVAGHRIECPDGITHLPTPGEVREVAANGETVEHNTPNSASPLIESGAAPLPRVTAVVATHATAAHISTLDRSPALSTLRPVSARRLREIAEQVRTAGVPAAVFVSGRRETR
jgi:hypothetical protein